MKEGLDVEEGKVDLTIIVFVTLKGKEKEKLIHGLVIHVFIRLSCQKNTNISGKTKFYKREVWGLKCNVKTDKVAVYNQLSGPVDLDETAGYHQLKNCGGLTLL